MSILCKIVGHKWNYFREYSTCTRCGLKCSHETQYPLTSCSNKCSLCGNTLNHHQWLPASPDGQMKCAQCGATQIDQNIHSEYLARQKEETRLRLEKEAQAKEARVLKPYLYADGSFRCMVCNQIKPMESMYAPYHRPVCPTCAGKLKPCHDHLIFEKVNGYETERTCIKCFCSEEYRDAELQGPPLDRQPCKL